MSTELRRILFLTHVHTYPIQVCDSTRCARGSSALVELGIPCLHCFEALPVRQHTDQLQDGCKRSPTHGPLVDGTAPFWACDFLTDSWTSHRECAAFTTTSVATYCEFHGVLEEVLGLLLPGPSLLRIFGKSGYLTHCLLGEVGPAEKVGVVSLGRRDSNLKVSVTYSLRRLASSRGDKSTSSSCSSSSRNRGGSWSGSSSMTGPRRWTNSSISGMSARLAAPAVREVFEGESAIKLGKGYR